jgi:membrane protein
MATPMPQLVVSIWNMLKATFINWSKDEAPRLGAALAYYAAFSLAPLLVILVAVVSFFYRDDSAAQIKQHIEANVGPDAAGLLAEAIDNSKDWGVGVFAAVVGIAVEIIGATGVFVELRAAINRIFKISPQNSSGPKGFIKSRVVAVAMVLAVSLLLLASVVLSAEISAAAPHLGHLSRGAAYFWRIVDSGSSLLVITVLFAMLFRYVPDVRIPWRDLWVGAAVTAILFVIGKYLIGLYLAKGAVGSTFGAAGTLMALLAWIYYSAQVVFFGAEFTQVYAERYGSRAPSRQRPAA